MTARMSDSIRYRHTHRALRREVEVHERATALVDRMFDELRSGTLQTHMVGCLSDAPGDDACFGVSSSHNSPGGAEPSGLFGGA
jgi:hypothetical protein